jgi:hypothetical protein
MTILAFTRLNYLRFSLPMGIPLSILATRGTRTILSLIYRYKSTGVFLNPNYLPSFVPMNIRHCSLTILLPFILIWSIEICHFKFCVKYDARLMESYLSAFILLVSTCYVIVCIICIRIYIDNKGTSKMLYWNIKMIF